MKKKNDTMAFLEALTGGPLTFGNMIESIRLADEVSQVKFAEKLGISRQNLWEIEHERRFVSPKTAVEFAKKLEQSEAQFVRICIKDMLRRDNIHYDIQLVA